MKLSGFYALVKRYGFAVGIVVFLAVIGLAGRSYNQLLDRSQLVSHTNRVLDCISTIETLVERLETYERGYMLIGDSRFQKKFDEARNGLMDELHKVQELVADNPAQIARTRDLEDLAAKRVHDLQELNKRVGIDDVKTLAKSFNIDSVMKLRELAGQIQAVEEQLLIEREQAARQLAISATYQMAVGAIIALLFMFASYFSLRGGKRESEQQTSLLKSIFASIGDGLFVVDNDGTITQFNRSVESLLAVDFSTVHSIADLRQKHDVREDKSPVTRALKGEVVTNFEITTATPPRQLSVDAHPVTTGSGEQIGAVALVRDVTQQKAIENEWQAARESAIEASRLKSDFLATMSHEIRTPMNGVMGMATLLLATKLDGEQSSYVKTIKSSADSLLALINQILDHSRIESGKLDLESVDFSLNELLSGVMDLFRYLARSKRVTLNLEIATEVPDRVKGDPNRVRQIVLNLVGNALKFTEAGQVKVNVSLLKGDADFLQLQVDVRDSGKGIPLEMQSQLFQKFSQVHDKQYQNAAGSGLGLMISKELVQALGGEIGLESTVGAGSRFWFTLQLARADAQEARVEIAEVDSLQLVGNVLVAEDQPINQVVIGKYLESFGLSSTIVRDGEAAISALANVHFDLILMDCQMLPMDGYDATLKIREKETQTGNHVPIIALTAEGMSGDRNRCFQVGMDDFISKPVEIAVLHRVLRRYLKTSQTEMAMSTKAANTASPLTADAAESDFDSEALAQLAPYQSGGRPLVEVLTEEFLSAGEQDLISLEVAFARGDVAKIGFLAHALKSNGRTLGLTRLGQICQDLENLFTVDDLAKAKFEDLKTAFARGREWLDKRPPAGKLSS